MDPLLGALLTFTLRVIDVSVMIVRMQMVVRGRKGLAWLFGFAQALVYVLAIRQVMADLGNWVNILAYAGGFATGNVVGMLIEEKMGIGYGHMRIMSPRLGSSLTEQLRAAGYGVTLLAGRGKEGMVDILITTVNRRQVKVISKLVEQTDPEAFITVENVRPLRKGFF